MRWQILVPLDGSVLADSAIPWADRLGAALAARVTLIRLVTPAVVPTASSDQQERSLVDAELMWARRSLGKRTTRFQRDKPTDAIVLHGPAGELIAAHARATADLVVIASHGRTGLERVLQGSVAATAIRESGVPVLVVGPKASEPPPQLHGRVLVPLDGSEQAAEVLPHVTPFARALGWRLALFGAIPSGAMGATGVDSWEGLLAYLDRKAAELRTQGLEAEAAIRGGYPGPSIAAFASDAHADLIALSTHSRTGLDRWKSGSVAEYLIAHATRPVLVVHPLTTPFGMRRHPDGEEHSQNGRLKLDRPTSGQDHPTPPPQTTRRAMAGPHREGIKLGKEPVKTDRGGGGNGTQFPNGECGARNVV